MSTTSRALLSALVFVAACRRHRYHESAVDLATPPPPLARAAPNPAEAAPPPPPSAEVTRSTPPTVEELHAQLDTHLGEVGECVRAAGLPADLAVTPLVLRLVIGPEGLVMGAVVVGSATAQPCVFAKLRPVRFAPWKGETISVALPIDSEGKPAMVPTVAKPEGNEKELAPR
jgi:hypothetical protein